MILAAIGVMLGACSTKASRHEADLDALRHALPGIYASTAEAGQPNSSSSVSIQVAIIPIIAQAIGDPVYFVRESAAGNERLILAQHIWTLALDPQGRMVQQMSMFKDPRRWVGAGENRDLLLALLPDDLAPLNGCDLVWQRSATGFEAAPARAPDVCTPGAKAQGQWLGRELKLEGSQLSLHERQVDSEGALSVTAGSNVLMLQRLGSAGSTKRTSP